MRMLDQQDMLDQQAAFFALVEEAGSGNIEGAESIYRGLITLLTSQLALACRVMLNDAQNALHFDQNASEPVSDSFIEKLEKTYEYLKGKLDEQLDSMDRDLAASGFDTEGINAEIMEYVQANPGKPFPDGYAKELADKYRKK